ncbi:MAG: hypothetical protein NTV31_05485 [Bacteroidia bacterium]|nr:hypothetical protein [Bacteroidia bacterium]
MQTVLEDGHAKGKSLSAIMGMCKTGTESGQLFMAGYSRDIPQFHSGDNIPYPMT